MPLDIPSTCPDFEEGLEDAQQAIQLMRERGLGDPEATAALDAWCHLQQAKIDQGGGSEEQLLLNDLRLALIYYYAGYFEQGKKVLDGAVETVDDCPHVAHLNPWVEATITIARRLRGLDK